MFNMCVLIIHVLFFVQTAYRMYTYTM